MPLCSLLQPLTVARLRMIDAIPVVALSVRRRISAFARIRIYPSPPPVAPGTFRFTRRWFDIVMSGLVSRTSILTEREVCTLLVVVVCCVLRAREREGETQHDRPLVRFCVCCHTTSVTPGALAYERV